MRVLGISAFYHDSAACLVEDGRILAAAQEERFTRKKNDAEFPAQSIQFCLDHCEIAAQEIDRVVFYDKPFPKFERLLESYFAYAPRGIRSFVRSMPLWLKDKLFQKEALLRLLKNQISTQVDWSKKLLFSEHHLSHAASAFYPSPFEKAAVLTMDGVGEWATTSIATGNGSNLAILREIHFPHSLGLLYSAFTSYLGFKVNSGEYKVMGLAPYGRPVHAKRIMSEMLHLHDDGSFRLNMKYFAYGSGLKMTNRRFETFFGKPQRKPDSALTGDDMDIAASLQVALETAVLHLARATARLTGHTNLCLAGGVALNCVANGKLQQAGIFENIWIQPAAGDSGSALGSALAVTYQRERIPRVVSAADSMHGSFLGPAFSSEQIRAQLTDCQAVFHELSSEETLAKSAQALADGKAIGWFSGRMEFGPRALGGRSIIADARSATMQKQLNLKIKYRESFRPFAPSVLSEFASDWFDLTTKSPYMLLVAPVKNEKRTAPEADLEKRLFGIDLLNMRRSEIPAVTHVDYSARIQTVHLETNKRYHDLISRFHDLTGYPLIVNTSFNVRGEPIVCTPEDAFRCFMGTDLDILVVEDFFLVKSEQPLALRKIYHREIEPD